MQSDAPRTVHPDATTGGPRAAYLALWAALAAYAALVVWQAFTLPESVPGHIGPDGQVTWWSTRTQHVITAALLGAFMVAVFWLPAAFLRKLDPGLVNLPHKDYWLRPENRPTAERLLKEDMAWMLAATLVYVGLAMWHVGTVATGDPAPWWLFWVVTGVFLAGIIAYSVWMSKGSRWRPPSDADLRR